MSRFSFFGDKKFHSIALSLCAACDCALVHTLASHFFNLPLHEDVQHTYNNDLLQ